MNDETLQANMRGFERCERLLADPDVVWLIEEALARPRKDAEARLKDTATNRDDREIAAHVRDALETAETFLTRQRDIFSRGIPRQEK